jgi:hypothetical protein
MAADKTIKDILAATEKAVEDFQKGIPSIQKGVLDSVLLELRELEVNGDTCPEFCTEPEAACQD